jgi:ComF family protein
MKIHAEWLGGTLRRQPNRARAVNKWPSIIQEWLYPPTCLLCGDPGCDGVDLCLSCREALPFISRACPRCALPVAAAEPQLCNACRTNPPAFHAAFAPLRYEEPVGHLVRSLKFAARYPAARLLGTLLSEQLAGRADQPEAILPVPLHAARYRERGYNQAIEIARTASRRLGVPLDLDACRRVRATSAQAQLAAVERRKNLRGAFAVRAAELPYGHVAILDDVVTTGSTVNELARTLRAAGVARVDVWACARAGRASGA